MENDQTAPKTALPTSLIIPAATVFISSFCIMVLELVAARLIARHLGSSLYTWTAVIGVVLAGISLGNYLGGRIADRFPAKKALALLFAVSSAACVLIVILNNLAGDWLWLWKLAWPSRVFTHVFLVFMLPSTLLGTISPVVAKMALDQGLPTGRTVGAIYAWGAIGSIAGTFAAGYWLIGAIGTTTIIWLVGAILLLIGILYSTRLTVFCIWALLFVCAMALAIAPMPWCKTAGAALALREPHDPSEIYRDESQYCSISVKRTSKYPDQRIFVQDKLTHSEIVMGDINDLQYFYTKIYAAVTHGLSTDNKTLSVMVIGGGGYVFPRYVEKNWPGSYIEVVEIDPGVTKAAIKAFGLRPDTTIKTLNMDARNYIDRLLRHRRITGREILYDFIYGDAVNDYSAPYQLLTKEFNDKISQLLTDRGVYMLTLIEVYDQAAYLGAVVHTLKQTFPNVYVMTDARMPDWARNTFVVIASRRPLDLKSIISEYPRKLNLRSLNEAGMEYLRQKSNGIILSDDYAPVENLLAPVVRQSAKGFLAHKYMRDAQKLDRLGKFDQAVESYGKAAEIKPQLTIDAFGRIGIIHLDQKRFTDAVNALQKAIEYNGTKKVNRNLASLHLKLGIALQELNRREDAAGHYRKAVLGFDTLTQRHSDSPELHFSFGTALVKAADFKTAANALQRAVDLDPDNAEYYIELAKVLEFLKRYDEAISLLQEAIENIPPLQRENDLAQLRVYLKLIELRKKEASSSNN